MMNKEKTLSMRLTEKEIDLLDQLRGGRNRSDFLRYIIKLFANGNIFRGKSGDGKEYTFVRIGE